MDLLLDADATVAMRGLSLLPHVLATSATVAFTGYIYDHELRQPADLEVLRKAGGIAIHHVLIRTPADARRRALIKEERLDKGEAEAIAWLLDDPARAASTWFVTLDTDARRFARASGLRAVDVAELAAVLVMTNLLAESTVRPLLSAWDDRRNQHGRPKRWKEFDTDFPRSMADLRARWADLP